MRLRDALDDAATDAVADLRIDLVDVLARAGQAVLRATNAATGPRRG